MIVLHLGAHRTGTTLFQKALSNNRETLLSKGISFIGPENIRDGKLDGLMPRQAELTPYQKTSAQNAAQKLAAMLEREQSAGRRIILSEEDRMGSVRHNINTKSIYPNFQRSIKILRPVFEKVDIFYLSIRSLEEWWNSCFSFAIQRFLRTPSDKQLDQIAHNSAFGWRTIIKALREAFPMSRIEVIEFGALTSSPGLQLAEVSGWADVADLQTKQRVINSSVPPDKLWDVLAKRNDHLGLARLARKSSGQKLTLFSSSGSNLLREAYDRDLAWLAGQEDERLRFIAAPC